MISIISINYNNKSGLERTIKSVINQTNKNVEYIVIDGGSTDGSVDVIKQYVSNISFWISEPDKGIYNAMNKGIEKTNGDYLIFLNSGDCFIDNSILQKSYDFLLEVPEADIYYGDMLVVNVPNQRESIHWKHPEVLDLNFLKVETINHQASLIKSTLFKELGSYPETYKVASDYWLWLLSLLNNKLFKHIGFPMVYYDYSGVSSTNRALYLKEKHEIWNSLVPKCVQEVIVENEQCKKLTEQYKQITQYKLVKAAINLNKKYQSLKGL